jgi:hypothetical protein
MVSPDSRSNLTGIQDSRRNTRIRQDTEFALVKVGSPGIAKNRDYISLLCPPVPGLLARIANAVNLKDSRDEVDFSVALPGFYGQPLYRHGIGRPGVEETSVVRGVEKAKAD